jgi:hypothetical protein
MTRFLSCSSNELLLLLLLLLLKRCSKVAEASNVLRTRVLEEFCSSFFDEKRSIFIASGSDLTDVLHRKGKSNRV